MINLIKSLLSNPLFTLGIVAFMSIFSLSAAFIAERFLNMEPCNLCIYQRYPFAIGGILGLLGIALYKRAGIVRAILGICSVNFLVNSGIATYHTGVELKWWVSALEGCSITAFKDDSSKSLLENIMGTPLTSCTDIQWQDPIIGLTMANYNIALCFGLCVFCILGAVMLKKPQAPS